MVALRPILIEELRLIDGRADSLRSSTKALGPATNGTQLEAKLY